MQSRDFIEALSHILHTFSTLKNEVRDKDLEYNVDRIFKILINGTSLENHNNKDISDNIMFLKIPQLIKSCMIKCMDNYILLIEPYVEEIDDSPLKFYTGVISRGFNILENLLIDDLDRFNEICNDISIHTKIYSLIYEFY